MQRRVFLLGLSGLVLAGCSTPPAADPPRISFDYLTPFRLDVRDYQVVNNYRAPNAQPNVEHLLEQPSWVVMDQWARRRIQPVGGAGQAVLTIQDASIVETMRTIEDHIGPFDNSKQRYVYTAHFQVRLDVSAPAWRMHGYAMAEGRGHLEVPEKSTLSEHDVALVKLVESTINDLNQAFEQEVQRNFRALLS